MRIGHALPQVKAVIVVNAPTARADVAECLALAAGARRVVSSAKRFALLTKVPKT